MALSIIVMVVAAAFIALNWMSFIAFILARSEGNFSFAPPFLCGVIGAIAGSMSDQPHAFWIFAAFLLLDPSIGLALGAIAVKKCLGRL